MANIRDFIVNLAPGDWRDYGRMAMTAVVVLVGFKVISVLIGRLMRGRASTGNIRLVRKIFRYSAFVVVAMTILKRMGIDLSAVLGAAGIAGIAVGFAAQTSVSNVISGLFLISEKPFSVDDAVQVGDVVGVVQSVDLLSVKIRTYDNRFVRIPNETIIKSNVVNVTRFPIRRLDLRLSVSLLEDPDRVRAVLEELARNNILALDNPEPLILFDQFDSTGLSILFGLWVERDDFARLKNSMMADIVKRFRAEGIGISYPRMEVALAGASAAAEKRVAEPS